MLAIRGATTIENDDRKEIITAVNEMLDLIIMKNKLRKEDIVCILFSNTSDISSFYPAAAAREGGYTMCALYSSLEPEMEGSLKKCIRVMVLADAGIERGNIKHIYLNKAASLRKDLTE